MRERISKLYLFLNGGASYADSYWLTRLWTIRSLGLLCLVTYAILFLQGPGLWSDQGLLPISTFIESLRKQSGKSDSELFFLLPSLFYFFNADILIRVLSAIGVVLSLCLIRARVNFFILLALWLIQLSFVNSGQLFYGYGWEIQLLEFLFLCFFMVPLFKTDLINSDMQPPRIVIWAQRWMLFRLMLGAGLIKIRGDACWSDLTCLVYHYETQPVPHPISYVYHQMPAIFHYGGVVFNHFVELIVPFGVFGPKWVRRFAGIIIAIFQMILISSGNLAWLNWLTLLMCVPCFDDEVLWIFGRRMGERLYKAGQVSLRVMYSRTALLSLFSAVILFLSWRPALNLISENQAMNTSYDSWHIVNSYGAFGSIGKDRYEIIIKGTQDETITEKTEWKEYQFLCKPGDAQRRPCSITPYHYHLDWQMWFSAMRPELQEEWLFRLAVRLLEKNELILDMIEESPFGDQAPKHIKMDLYKYNFAPLDVWPKNWWTRSLSKEYMPPVSLQTPQVQPYRLK